ncbi:MAG TPA: SDR family NAD(P)-dependent oxidoreductase [Acidimicrobiia bacterium]|nr:SDR family NAD(P)-dependent oxidoreductase [Acidimicrobiia bacterium]
MPVPDAALLAGKVAVVTGGGGGIGRAVSETFAGNAAKVVVAEIDADRAAETVEAIRAAGGDALAQPVDVRHRDEVASLADAVHDEYGRVDVLVNNVGHYLFPATPFLDTDDEHWDSLYAVNLRHMFLCTKAFAPRMVEQGDGGSIVNVSTVEAFRGIPLMAAYSAFKAGVTQFTKSLALELGNDGIRVNAIAPDLTETIQVPYERWVPEEQRHLVPRWVPVGRFGTPDDIAGVALFLASDLSAFVTGTTVHADGGSLAAGGWYRTERGRWTNRPRNP